MPTMYLVQTPRAVKLLSALKENTDKDLYHLAVASVKWGL